MTRRTASALASILAASACLAGCGTTTYYGLSVRPPHLDAGRMVVSWEPFQIPPEWTSDPTASPGEVLRVTYEVRMLHDGRIEYERRGVATNELQVGMPPQDPRRYLWIVRARVETTHGVRLGPWSEDANDFIAGRQTAVPPSITTTSDAD